MDDLDLEIQRLEHQGYKTISPPLKGADDKLITFLHPKDTNGVLIELCMLVICKANLILYLLDNRQNQYDTLIIKDK